MSEATDVHHLGAYNDHSDHNLVALCAYHHGKLTSARANAAQRKASTKRSPEKHPGIL